MLDTVLLLAILAVTATHFYYAVYRTRTWKQRVYGVVKKEFTEAVSKQTAAIRSAHMDKPLIDLLRANPGMSASEALRILKESGDGQ